MTTEMFLLCSYNNIVVFLVSSLGRDVVSTRFVWMGAVILIHNFFLLINNAEYRVSQKMTQLFFCQNFVKSSPNLLIFGVRIAKTVELCQMFSFPTSSSLCQCTTV